MKNVGKALYELMKNIPAGNKVYALRAPQGETGPFIIYQRVDADRWRAINGPSGEVQAEYRIDAYADEYYACSELAGQIETALDGFRGSVQYDGDSPQDSVFISGISLQTDSDLLDETEKPLLFRNTALYLVTYKQR